MDATRFDDLAMRLARRGDRRSALRALLGTALGGGSAAAWATAGEAKGCFIKGRRCRKHRQCCSGRCRHGECARCRKGTRECGHACVDTRTDRKHCGGCGRRCPAGDACLVPFCWRAWGGNGVGPGRFLGPFAVAVAGDGRVYVVDAGNNRIQQFTATGGFVRAWGSQGSGDGQFNGPHGVAVGEDGRVYVADTENHRIQEFTATGGFVRAWGSDGTGEGQFRRPTGVAVARNGRVYVADFSNDRIQRFIPA